jgi:histidine decarboxylase
VARHHGLADGSIEPLMQRRRHDGIEVPVLPVASLLEAGERLFGTADDRRFPLLPGSHVICATKDITVSGPTSVWSAIALAIAEDREHLVLAKNAAPDPASRLLAMSLPEWEAHYV